MDSIWLGLCPSERSTRILAMRGPTDTILKAHLSLRPSSPRAVIALLEAVALWEGLPVRAALVVDDGSTSSSTTLYRDTFSMFGDQTPLYSLEWVPRRAARRRRDELSGMGDFGDLERVDDIGLSGCAELAKMMLDAELPGFADEGDVFAGAVCVDVSEQGFNALVNDLEVKSARQGFGLPLWGGGRAGNTLRCRLPDSRHASL